MEKVRCLIADLPQRMLGDIVKIVVDQEDSIELVGNVKNVDNLPQFVVDESIEFLIVGIDSNHLDHFYNGLIKIVSDVVVLGLIDEGHDAIFYLEDIGVNDMVKIFSLLSRP